MKDIPVIFSAPMVRALLDRRKFMTRRIASLHNCEFGSIPAGKLSKLFWEHAAWADASPDRGFPDEIGRYTHSYMHVPCHDRDDGDSHCPLCSERGWSSTSHRFYPKASPGDRLWVRENHRFRSWNEDGDFVVQYVADDARSKWISPSDGDEAQKLMERLSSELERKGVSPGEDGYYPSTEKLRTFPSIHMPRWASRLTLDVRAVKIERLQDITHEESELEGVKCDMSMRGFKDHFCALWKRLHGEGAWKANPIVVALTFDVHHCNIDAMPVAAAA